MKIYSHDIESWSTGAWLNWYVRHKRSQKGAFTVIMICFPRVRIDFYMTYNNVNVVTYLVTYVHSTW